MEEEEQCQDIDIARFILKEVDNTGITVAAVDRFSSRIHTNSETDGETSIINKRLRLLPW